MAFTYPPARRADVVDDYHGTPVADPYRWLEDPDLRRPKPSSRPRTKSLSPIWPSLPERPALRDRMEALWDVPRTGAPTVRNGIAVWAHNDGLQDQPVFYVRRAGREDQPLLDPNTLSEDGAVAVIGISLSDDGRSSGLLGCRSGQRLADHPDSRHRNRPDHPGRAASMSSSPMSPGTVTVSSTRGFRPRIHPRPNPLAIKPCTSIDWAIPRTGDTLVFANPDDPDLGYEATVSDDGLFPDSRPNGKGLHTRTVCSTDRSTTLVANGSGWLPPAGRSSASSPITMGRFCFTPTLTHPTDASSGCHSIIRNSSRTSSASATRRSNWRRRSRPVDHRHAQRGFAPPPDLSISTARRPVQSSCRATARWTS